MIPASSQVINPNNLYCLSFESKILKLCSDELMLVSPTFVVLVPSPGFYKSINPTRGACQLRGDWTTYLYQTSHWLRSLIDKLGRVERFILCTIRMIVFGQRSVRGVTCDVVTPLTKRKRSDLVAILILYPLNTKHQSSMDIHLSTDRSSERSFLKWMLTLK